MGFDTSQVTDMTYMFFQCSSLESLDLSGFDTSQVTSMSWMFDYCPSLERVSLGERFSFKGCTLPGGWWRSAATGRDHTATQIAAERGGIADV